MAIRQLLESGHNNMSLTAGEMMTLLEFCLNTVFTLDPHEAPTQGQSFAGQITRTRARMMAEAGQARDNPPPPFLILVNPYFDTLSRHITHPFNPP